MSSQTNIFDKDRLWVMFIAAVKSVMLFMTGLSKFAQGVVLEKSSGEKGRELRAAGVRSMKDSFSGAMVPLVLMTLLLLGIGDLLYQSRSENALEIREVLKSATSIVDEEFRNRGVLDKINDAAVQTRIAEKCLQLDLGECPNDFQMAFRKRFESLQKASPTDLKSAGIGLAAEAVSAFTGEAMGEVVRGVAGEISDSNIDNLAHELQKCDDELIEVCNNYEVNFDIERDFYWGR